MAVRRMLITGRYRLLEPVGSGGMGRVWLARDEMLDRDVAVKEFVPPEWMSADEQAKLRTKTLREARSAARLNHPHVVRIYDVVHAEDLPWIVMEYVPSRSLYHVISEDGPFDPAGTARIGLAVLDALSAAHRAGVLHRDVKPHNVLIGHDNRVVLTDFGLATFVDDGAMTAPGLVVGSPQYVSPERARDGASTVESDLYSLGATLYAAVEGRSPYARESAMATLTALATEEPDIPVLAGPLAPVLTGLLRRDPSTRLTAPEVENGLREVLATEGRIPAPRRVVVPNPRRPMQSVASDVAVQSLPLPPEPAIRSSAAPISPAPAPQSRRRRGPAITSAVLVGVLGVGGAVGYGVWRNQNDAIKTPVVAAPTTSPTTGVVNFTPSVCAAEPSSATLPHTPQAGAARDVNGWGLLDGYSFFHDQASGLHMAVPDGWSYERTGTTICFRDPGNVRYLSVDTGRNPDTDPLKACETAEKNLVAAGELPAYKKLAMDYTTLQSESADWEYRYQAANLVNMHAGVRWFAEGGKAFAVGLATREPDWTNNIEVFRMLKSSIYVNKPTGKRASPSPAAS